MLRTNADRLPCTSMTAKVREMRLSPFFGTWMDADGYGRFMQGPGGITYNFQLGDPCMNIDGHLIEPGVSVEGIDPVMQFYGCIGNDVVITSGDAKGCHGIYTGKTDNRTSTVYFPRETLEKMDGEEHFLIHCYGMGLSFPDFPDIRVLNIDPRLLEKMGIEEKDGILCVPVTHIIPSILMGDGWGTPPFDDDAEILTDDSEAYEQYHLDTLRFGDVVMVEDFDTTQGRTALTGSVTIGIVVHGNGAGAGKGPGINTVLACKKRMIRGILDPEANITSYLGINKGDAEQC